jgi:hypothetical protein
MDTRLAIEILERIAKGETFGRETIFNELKQTETYFDLTKEDYMSTLNALENNDCILRDSSRPQGGYRIQNPKCLELYKRNVKAETSQQNVKARIEFLTAENLRLSNENFEMQKILTPLQIKDAKTKRLWGVGGAAVGIAAETLIVYGKDILKALHIIS